MPVGFENQFKFEDGDTDDDKRRRLFMFCQGLKASLDRSKILRDRFATLHGKTLGCWCVNWDGIGQKIPLCHACYIARLVHFFDAFRVVCVYETGFMTGGNITPTREGESNDPPLIFERTW
jgi:hypothetical protein